MPPEDCTGDDQIVDIAMSRAKSPRTTSAHPDRMKAMDYRLLTEVVFTEPQVASSV